MNLENLKILADYLEALPGDYQHFDMGVFCRNDDGDELDVGAHDCGTSMCALGHAPNAGIAPLENENSWLDYAERVFGEDWWDNNM